MIQNSQDVPAPPLSQSSYLEPTQLSQEDSQEGRKGPGSGLVQRLERAATLATSDKAAAVKRPLERLHLEVLETSSSKSMVDMDTDSQEVQASAFRRRSPIPKAKPALVVDEHLKHFVGGAGAEMVNRERAIATVASAGGGTEGSPSRWNVHNLGGASATPIRRHTGGSGSSSGGNTQKRSGRAGERSSPSEKRPRLDAQPQQPPQAREWADRLQKRQNCITFIRTTEGYQRLQLARQTEEATSAPTTPDPNDSTMSKRMWESSVQHFREDIRRWCERHPGTAPVPPQEPVEDEVEAIESQEP